MERTSETIKQRNDIFREIARHTINDESDKQIRCHKRAIGIEQKKLLKYRKELRKIIEKISSGSSGSQSGKWLKILTPQQMLTRLPILLAQIKAGNNPQEL